MKRFLIALCAFLVSLGAFAQNDKADNIVGTYMCGTVLGIGESVTWVKQE